VGPSGWGKTHLLDAASERMRGGFPAPRRIDLQKFLQSPSKYENAGALILDDCQDALTKAKARQSLRFHLERRVKANRPTLLAFAAAKPNRHVRALLPASRDWLVCGLAAPTADEREQLLDTLAAAERLELASDLRRIIARQMHGNGRTLAGALKRLRLAGPTWSHSKDVIRACGVLDPFFADNPSWDLRHSILRIAERNQDLFPSTPWLDVALYVMLDEAGLGETEVAWAADVEPAQAYIRACRFRKALAASPEMQAVMAVFLDLIVRKLAKE
jgi:hypothetical protein